MWKFDNESFTGHPEFSPDCLAVTSKRFDVESVVGTNDFLTGKHTWSLKITKFGRGLAVWIGQKGEYRHKLGWKSGNKWVWTSGGTKYSPQSFVIQSPLEWWVEGDILKFTLDCDKQELVIENLRTKKRDTLTGFDEAVQPYFDLFLDVSIALIEVDGIGLE